MNHFSARELQLLAAVCDTLFPAIEATDADSATNNGFYARNASAIALPARMATILEHAATPDDFTQLKLALGLLDQPMLNVFMGGVGHSFLRMSLDERTRTLQDWAGSRLAMRRKAISVLKRLAGFLFYTMIDEEGCNPNWAALGYPGPKPAPQQKPKPLHPTIINADTVLEADVVIIGSGAGGGVAAGVLSAAGHSVVILEKGGYYTEPDFHGHELRSQQETLEKGGLAASADLHMLVLAGATLGGGTTINWSAAFRTPNNVLAEWENDYGVSGYTGAGYQASLDAVSARINVNCDNSVANARNAALVRGSQALGHEIHPIPRNVKDCQDCGFCNFGCAYGAKQSVVVTYLQDAASRGARIVVGTTAKKVIVQNGRAVGVEAETTVRAKLVVAAGGTIHTPALLLRSGLSNANIGRNLHMHPASGAFGIYEEQINGWEGVMMSHYMPQFNNLDGKGYGVTLESAPGHPGLSAISFPWVDGLQHKQLMDAYDHCANILVLTRDRDGGRVTIDREGHPVLNYSISEHDRRHLLRGLTEAMRIHRAAGAKQIFGPLNSAGLFPGGSDADFERYLGKYTMDTLRAYDYVLGSAHQMSSCRMGGNPARGALKPTGESFEVKNLFVADGSALPTSTGVNPMLTIMGVAHCIAGHAKDAL
jgi:choline dehydrogenase-like flavoprotein